MHHYYFDAGHRKEDMETREAAEDYYVPLIVPKHSLYSIQA